MANKLKMVDQLELYEALIEAADTLEWVWNCTTPNQNVIKEAIDAARRVLSKYEQGN